MCRINYYFSNTISQIVECKCVRICDGDIMYHKINFKKYTKSGLEMTSWSWEIFSRIYL